MANPTKKTLKGLSLRAKSVLIFSFLGLLIGIISNLIIQRSLQPILQDTLPTIKEGEQILQMTQQLQAETALYLATGDEIHKTHSVRIEGELISKLNEYSQFLGNDPNEVEALEAFTQSVNEFTVIGRRTTESHFKTLELLDELEEFGHDITALSVAAHETVNYEIIRNSQDENFEELEDDALVTKDLLNAFFLATQVLQREANEYIVLSNADTLEEFEETTASLEELQKELSLTLEENESGELAILNQIIDIREELAPLSRAVITSHTETLALVAELDNAVANLELVSADIESAVNKEVENALQISRNSVFSSLVVGALIALLGFLITNTLLAPILKLAEVSKLISAGKLDSRVEVKSRDEIGLLSVDFNEMAEKMQSSLGDLGERVVERTTELERISTQAEKQAAQLKTIADVANSVASLQGVDQLLPYITQVISERFGFYHVGIFLLSSDTEYAVLQASNSEGGQAMLARNHQLRIDQESIVGITIEEKKTHISLDVDKDATYFDNPDLPATRSEMALPLVAGDTTIGALDIQSELSNAFSSDDIDGLTTLANQVAIAIRNADLFQQSQEALEELDITFQQYISDQWSRFSKATDVKGYHASEAGLRPIKKSLQKNDNVEKDDTLYEVPIKLRDVVIGYLNINLDKPVSQYSEDELGIIQATVDRFALAVENARLLETTSKRAARERLVSEITTKMRSTNEPDQILQTAMEELKKALDASRVKLDIISPEQAEDVSD
ncbi:MAG: GAF domain-containing protein [Anaerolineae bacterium]|nr:GAF domain-containing protein [Anaerolineae bacterium]